MSQQYAWKAYITGSSDENVAIAATSFYTGSTVKVEGYPFITVAGMIYTGSAYNPVPRNLGVSCTIYLSYSMDGTTWNNFNAYSGSIRSGSVPYIALKQTEVGTATTDLVLYPKFVRGILYNASGSGLTGSIWVYAFR
jgi:hypothetical protein